MRETIGHYKVLDRLGAGGIGDVYRARDTRLGRTVALRFVSSDIASTPKRRERFMADARMATVLSHPNIASVYEVGEEDGQLYLAMEYVPGDPLTRLTAGHGLNPRRALDYAIEIADAVADAHALGVVHGDLCGSNVIITPKGHAKLLEFGLTAWTSGGKARGKRDDIVSLGALIVEMTTGQPPREGAPAAARPPGALPTAAPELDPIVARMLSSDLDSGYSSAALVAADLRRVAAAIGERRAAPQNAPSAAPSAPPKTATSLPELAASTSPARWTWLLLVLVLLAAVGWILSR